MRVQKKSEKGAVMRLIKYFLFSFMILLAKHADGATYTYASGVTATDNVSATTLAKAIEGTGITITNPVIKHGAPTQYGIFSNGNAAGLEIDSGIILTGMNVQESFTTNSNWRTSIQESGTYSDSDLTAIDSSAIYNPIIFEFDVTLDENTRLLLIDYQFASEEYNEYVGSRFNDAFGFFISGGDLNQTYNIARVVDNNTYVTVDNLANYAPVTVNNVNNGSVGTYDDSTPEILTNSQYFIDNCDEDNGGPDCDQKNPPVQVEYDGLTHTLHATLDNLTPGETYHFKLAIADTSDALWDTGVFIHQINGLREPSLCYDYAYKQNNVYFTEVYDSASGPKISGSVIANDPAYPVEVSMYLKNTKESEILVSNVTFNIIDINTTQATYTPESVWVTQPGNAFKTKIDDAVLDVSDSYIKNIPIDSFDAFEYFYTYFSLDPKQSKLDMPLNAKIDYDLTIPLSANDSLTVHRTSFIDGDVPLCTGGDFTYRPAKGIFNIVNANYATSLTSTGYFDNLPTQVTKRVGNFKVLSLDPDNLDQPKGISTIVAVDMIDAAAYHDTNASCQELSSSISDRIWVLFENNATITNFDASIGISPDFYKNARQNAAFRVSYNVMTESGDMPLVQKENDGTYTIINWRTEWEGESCMQDMDGNPSNLDSVASYCNDTGNNPNDLIACMECVYGFDVRMVCSRDNFAIRPEALHIRLSDSNTSSGTIMVPEGNTTQNIAAGYDYTIEVNATTYIDDTPSFGYVKSFSDTTVPKDVFAYQWAPSSGVVTTGCNDTDDKNETITITHGTVTDTTKINQVGEYNLVLRDKSWTAVDSDPAYMTHHSGSFFKAGLDCVADSSDVVLTTVAGLNGCEISSNHYNPYLGKQYYDYKLNVLPYKFDLSTIGSSTGLNDANATTNNFVYNANIDDTNGSGVYTDLNMSYHIYGNIEAKGQNDSALTNFVAGCYAKDIGVTLPRSSYADTNMTFRQSLETLDQNNTRISIGFEDANNSKFLVFVPQSSFAKQLNGKANVRIRYNFARDISQARNPQQITFNTLSVDCNNTAECQSIANSSTTFQPTSTKVINDTIYFYYARAHAPKMVTNGPDGTAKGYYEVYCYGSGCNKNYLPDELAGGTSSNSDDPRWWINTAHSYDYGKIKMVSQKRTPANVSATLSVSADGSYTNIALHYNGSKGYPYRAIMNIVPDKWLIYNKYDANADHNEFEAQFNNDTSAWIGSGETQDATETKKFGYKDRTLTW